MPAKPVLLVHNPTAGNGDASASSLQKLLREFDYRPQYRSSKEKGWKQALDKPPELVIAAGGDGTVTKVAKALRGRDTVLAVLPLGTANNIAQGLGVRGKPRDIIKTWAKAKPKPFDFWIAKGPWGEELVVEGCGLGAIADAAAKMTGSSLSQAERMSKLAISRGFTLAHVRDCPPFELRAKCDSKEIEDEFLLFEAMNVGSVGPRLPLAGRANPSDGKLDVAYVPASRRQALLDWLDAGAPAKETPIKSMRCKGLRLKWRGARLRLGDGHFWPENGDAAPEKAKAEIARASSRLRVLIPT